MRTPQALLDQIRRLSATPAATQRVSLGADAVDNALKGGLKAGALHEVYAATPGDSGAASGFAIALAVKAARGKPVLWARQDMLDVEAGQIYAPGLAELGVDPLSLLLVRGRDADAVLKAGEDAARCAGIGAVIIEPWGQAAHLNLTTSRRLVLATAASGVTVVMLRAAAPHPSAAETRWRVASAPSLRLDAHAPGLPAFDVTLLRQRGGAAGEKWRLEWCRDQLVFNACDEGAIPALSHPVVPPSADRTAEAFLRQAG